MLIELTTTVFSEQKLQLFIYQSQIQVNSNFYSPLPATDQFPPILQGPDVGSMSCLLQVMLISASAACSDSGCCR